MSPKERWSVSWKVPDGRLTAQEPALPELEAAAASLSTWYNDAHNSAMMAHETRMAPDDVLQHFARVWREGGRNFLLYADGRLMGDADLRHIDTATHTCELAIMIGERSVQGRGYGTRFALMVHALAYEGLGIERIYVSIIPSNRGSLRLFEKLGYQRDDSPAARSYIDEPDDVTLSLSRLEFLRQHAETIRQLTLAQRPPEASPPTS